MNFHDFPMFLGKIGMDLILPTSYVQPYARLSWTRGCGRGTVRQYLDFFIIVRVVKRPRGAPGPRKTIKRPIRIKRPSGAPELKFIVKSMEIDAKLQVSVRK